MFRRLVRKSLASARSLSSRAAPTFHLGIPLSLTGSVELPQFPDKYIIAEFAKARMLTDSYLTARFQQLYVQFLGGLKTGTERELSAICEPAFCSAVLGALSKIQKGMKIEYAAPFSKEPEIRIVEKLLIKGVSVIRKENGYNFDYTLITGLEDLGLRYYCHKYVLLKKQYDLNFEIPQESLPKGVTITEEMARKNRRLILRAIVQVKDPNRFSMVDRSSNGSKSQTIPYASGYNGVHTLVFENQLLEPKVRTVLVDDYVPWIKEYGIDRDSWLLTDVDNYMRGNPYFKKLVPEETKKVEPPKEVKITEKEAGRLVDRLRELKNSKPEGK